jgi:hypothetical protein
MRRALIPGLLAAVAALVLTACVVEPPPGVSMPSKAGVATADARALRYGATGPEVMNNPELRDRIRALYGPDWGPSQKLPAGAEAYFPASSSLRMIRIGADDYIALTGCVQAACAANRGLLLIRQDGNQLLSRLDQGGLSHYYQYGIGATPTNVPRASIDGAWITIDRLERG